MISLLPSVVSVRLNGKGRTTANMRITVHHSTNYCINKGFKGPLIGPPLCRETPISRKANEFISGLGFNIVLSPKFVSDSFRIKSIGNLY